MRGKHFSVLIYFLKKRITPAGAGKTITRLSDIIGAEDHPRRCGENHGYTQTGKSAEGSPPQVRGKLSIYDVIETINRITPAGAGKTCRRWSGRYMRTDHPRRCGENFFRRPPCRVGRGSPPQVRGKPITAVPAESRKPITPAGAGKTCAAVYTSDAYAGSPPQVRGKPLSAAMRQR